MYLALNKDDKYINYKYYLYNILTEETIQVTSNL